MMRFPYQAKVTLMGGGRSASRNFTDFIEADTFPYMWNITPQIADLAKQMYKEEVEFPIESVSVDTWKWITSKIPPQLVRK